LILAPLLLPLPPQPLLPLPPYNLPNTNTNHLIDEPYNNVINPQHVDTAPMKLDDATNTNRDTNNTHTEEVNIDNMTYEEAARMLRNIPIPE